MKKMLLLFALLIPTCMFGQKSVTFKVEELSKPTELLPLKAYKDIHNYLIVQDLADEVQEQIFQKKLAAPYNIVARSKGPDSLVNYGEHSFFSGMYQAYADHRPFVLSPDMIWLLIEQGFARHISNNAEQLRKYFVNYEGKTSLVVNNNSVKLDDPNSPWEEVFPEFSKQIAAPAGKELANAMTADFTTTSPVSKAVSQITLMNAVEPYFEFVVITISCGIPEITLEGTPKDWQKVLDKAMYLKKYELAWWIDEIAPLLKEFVKASKGSADKEVWRNMFKYHSIEQYGSKVMIDGWITKFFPYFENGHRNHMKGITKASALPSEYVKVPVQHIELDARGNSIKTDLEVWAGFTGLEQNNKSFALKPQIGWMIRKKDPKYDRTLAMRFIDHANDEFDSGISIRVRAVPAELLAMKEIKKLSIDFLGDIVIPEEINKVKIGSFAMTGKITDDEIKRICRLLPDATLIINGKRYNEKERQKTL